MPFSIACAIYFFSFVKLWNCPVHGIISLLVVWIILFTANATFSLQHLAYNIRLTTFCQQHSTNNFPLKLSYATFLCNFPLLLPLATFLQNILLQLPDTIFGYKYVIKYTMNTKTDAAISHLWIFLKNLVIVHFLLRKIDCEQSFKLLLIDLFYPSNDLPSSNSFPKSS